MNRLTSMVLLRRGLDPEHMAELNDPHHKTLAHSVELCGRLHDIHESGDLIVIIPDFDCDGVMSNAVLYAGMRTLGFNVETFISDPKVGHAIPREEIDRLMREHPAVKAIITCDTGIDCAEGIKHAKDLGLVALITDHHKENIEDSARKYADVVVDPCGLDDTYDNKGICGAHVAWQVLMLYVSLYGTVHESDLIDRLRVFAGIGTVADIMPIVKENRQIVQDAIGICRLIHACGHRPSFYSEFHAPKEYGDAFRGLYEMLDVWYRNDGYINDPDDINENFFGFNIGPMINAVRRLEGDMGRLYGAFMGVDPQGTAEYLYTLNQQRRDTEKAYVETLKRNPGDYAPYVYEIDALKGYLGLLAGRLENESGRPTLVISQNPDGTFSGSGRSPAWYPFISSMERLGNPVWARGHEGAFGVKFKNREEIEHYFEVISLDVMNQISKLGDAVRQAKEPDLNISLDGHGDVGLDVPLLLEFVDDMNHFRPFGHGFEAPLIRIGFDAGMPGVRFSFPKQQEHCIIRLPFGGTEITCWHQGKIFEHGAPRHGHIEVVGTLDVVYYDSTPCLRLNGKITNPGV